MRVLNLVTNQAAQFYRTQVSVLESRGVEQTTVAVPGQRVTTDEETSPRSLLDYGRFYLRVLGTATEEYDLVHANYGLTAPAALAQPKRPVVVSLWGSDLLGRYGPMVRWCARRADAVIVMSRQMADVLSTECRVIPHGVDLERFRPMPRRQARSAVGWRHDAKHVLFPYPTGREVKDYPRAERVVRAARERIDDDVDLHAVHGVAHARMPLYLNAADALLLTSRWEGSPNSVKEALACNLPVVATDVGDVAERLDGVEPSHVCRTDEELVDGLVDVLQRGTPSDGRRAVEALSTDRVGERFLEVYASVL